jgi:protoporphyrin/coproporphyrin ferrochelatase
MTAPKPPDHPEVKPPKVGVLLLNLGTPDATDYWSMRRYLSEFLSDRRVIESPPAPIWQLILQGIILSVRPQKSGANYDKIWDARRTTARCASSAARRRQSCRRGWGTG